MTVIRMFNPIKTLRAVIIKIPQKVKANTFVTNGKIDLCSKDIKDTKKDQIILLELKKYNNQI